MHRHFTPQSGLVGGNVLESFHRLNQIIETNDGVRNFNVETNNCYNVEAPFTDDRETRIRITHNHHDINQLSQSFLRMEFDADVSFSQQITGPFTLIPDQSQKIEEPKETPSRHQPDPTIYDIETDIKTMVIPNQISVHNHYLISSDPNASAVGLNNYATLLNGKTSMLVLYCVDTSPNIFQICQLFYYGCQYDYSEVIQAIHERFEEIKVSLIDEIEILCTATIETWKITIKYPIDQQVLDFEGTEIADDGDIKFVDDDCAPVWFGVGDKKYLILVHNYNKPWNPWYKESLQQNQLIKNVPIYEIDFEYWPNLFNGRTRIFNNDSIVLKTLPPTYDSDEETIKTYDNSLGFESRLDPKIGIGVYWVKVLGVNFFIPLTSDDEKIDPTKENPKEDIMVLFDRLYIEGFRDFRWYYEKMKISDFRKTELANLPLVKLFLGWKNANEVIKQLQIENSNKDTKYSQRESTKEGFCYSTFMPNEEKKNNLFAHTSYENARSGFRGVCGGYIEVDPRNLDLDIIEKKPDFDAPYKLKKNFTVHNLEVILPINDILCFQHFNDFPGALGDIVLKMYLNKNSMVFCQCDPKISFDQAYLKRYKHVVDAPSALDHCVYYRGFTQVGREAKIISDYSTYDSDNISLSVTKLTCKKLSCECYGYNISQESKKQIVQLFSPEDPFLIPANQIDVVSFEKTMREMYQENQGTELRPNWVSHYKLVEHYNSELSWTLRNVSRIVIVFPQNSLDYTTFKNPMLKNLQLIIQGRQYPQTPFLTTCGQKFFAHMIRASNEESFYEADPDYVNSLLTPVFASDKNTVSDVTSFLMTFQTERSSDNVFFDGIETGSENVNIQLEFYKTKHTSENFMRYAPQLWLVRETYWTADVENGLRYWSKGTPEFETE